MIVRIANEKYQLETGIHIEDRIELIQSLLQQTLEFQNMTMSVEDYFHYTWDNPNTIKAMDMIAYYLTKVEQDLTVLSRKRMKEISRGSDRHVTFGSLGLEQQIRFGLQDTD